MNINSIWRWTVTKNCRKIYQYKLLIPDARLERVSTRFQSSYCPIVLNLTSNDTNCHRGKLFKSPDVVQKRNYCTSEGPLRRLPPLMKFPEIVWPSLWKSLRNFILTNFIIKPYFDREFNLPEFISGTKKAVEVRNSGLEKYGL